MSYGQHVTAAEMKQCLETIQELMKKLKPGFLILSDLSNLDSMDADCAQDVGAIMDICSSREVSKIVRVVPDPQKDIGFALISKFHHDPPVQTLTYESLAEAIYHLLKEPLQRPALV